MPDQPYPWPGGAKAAVSLSFDDGRASQLERGLPILDRYGVRGTFYVTPFALEQRLDDWRDACASGHEIANHTASHPCSGNFGFAHGNALEDYTLERLDDDIADASERIEEMVGAAPETFAYPCGQTFVGRGEGVKSYVPLIARRFVAGRTAFNETHNLPHYCDLAQVWSRDADDASPERVREFVNAALATGGWLILMSHDVGRGGRQVTWESTLAAVCGWARDESIGLYTDTVANVAKYIAANRKLSSL